MSTPGHDMSTMKTVMPRCFGASRSVRVIISPYREYCAPDVQTFCPLTIQSLPARSARVCSDATSDPAFGSDQSWHHTSSPDSIFGR